MIQAFSSAKLAMRAQQTRLDTIANNIANINTQGFRSGAITFKDTLYTTMEDGTVRGTGAIVAASARSMNQGTPMQTGVSLDFMIDGTGFFKVERSDGTQAYTRMGRFAVSAEQGGQYLVTANGDYVLDQNNSKISIPNGTKDIAVSTDGTLKTAGGTVIAKLNIACFSNPDGLSSIGNDCFVATEASGAAKNATSYTVKNGVLEGSNVDYAQEMVKLITTQRAYTIAGKALQTVDEMRATANNMRA